MSGNSFFKVLFFTAIILTVAAGGYPHPSLAHPDNITITVDTLTDVAASQACTASPNDCSLRGAISKANGDTGNSYIIILPAGGYYLNLSGSSDDNNAGGDLDIKVALTIDGPNPNTTFIDQNITDRVVQVHSGSHVSIDGIKIKGGFAVSGATGLNGQNGTGGTPPTNGNPGGDGGPGFSGGGIYNSGTLTLTQVIVTENYAGVGGDGGDGGEGGAGTAANGATGGAGGSGGDGGFGGGIYNLGTLMIVESTISNNYAGPGRDGGDGGDGGDAYGGVFTGGSAGAGGNAGVGGNGGGIHNSGTLTILASQITGNHAGSSGFPGSGGEGGLCSQPAGGDGGPGGDGGDSGTGGYGGGINNEGYLEISASTITGNFAGDSIFSSSLESGGGGGLGGHLGGNGGLGGLGRWGGYGGGISNNNILIVLDSTITNNKAGDGSRGGDGGYGGGGGFTVLGQAGLAGIGGAGGWGGGGGGISSSGTMTVTMSTINNNVTGTAGEGGDGGGGGAANSGAHLGKATAGGLGGQGGVGGFGGGISNGGHSLISYSTIQGNSTAAGGEGGRGGYGGFGGTVVGGWPGGAGGQAGAGGSGGPGAGIYTEGILVAKFNTIAQNTTGAGGAGGNGQQGGPGSYSPNPGGEGGNGGYGGPGGFGAGISVNSSAITLTLNTLSGNHNGAGGSGGSGGSGGAGTGAIGGAGGDAGSGGYGGYGGGLSSSGTGYLNHDTIAYNQTGAGSPAGTPGTGGTGTPAGPSGSPADSGSGGAGGGIYNSTGTVQLINTLIAMNSSTSSFPDILGLMTSFDFNLIGNLGTETFTSQIHDQVGTSISPINPQLSALASNGGETQTHALLLTSPAIESGVCLDLSGSTLTYDQRSLARLADLPAFTNDPNGCDIGAFELQPVFKVLKKVDHPTPIPGQSIIYTIIVTNTGTVSATNSALADALSTDLEYIGPVTLNPPGAGTTGSPPNLVTGLTIQNGAVVTVTLPVKLKIPLANGTVITNLASISSPVASISQSGNVEITVAGFGIFLPLTLR